MRIHRLFFIIFFQLVVVVSAIGQVKWNQRFQNYIDTYKDVAIQEMLRYKIPASITLAQGLLESAAGSSELATKANNHFGIKCHGWQGRTAYHDDDAKQECFRAYDNAIDSYEDHSKFLVGKQRYEKLFQLAMTDYKGWAHGLKSAGYATSPTYAYHLIEIIEAYQLYQFDYATSADKKSIEALMYGSAQTSPKEQKRKEVASELTPVDVPGVDLGNHEIKVCNGTYYVMARQGDTFDSIGAEMGVKAKKLASYNELPQDAVLIPNKPIYLEKKKKRADKVFEDNPHTVQSGESLYDIAQMYAIQLNSLYKMNRLPSNYQLQKGDVLRVY